MTVFRRWKRLKFSMLYSTFQCLYYKILLTPGIKIILSFGDIFDSYQDKCMYSTTMFIVYYVNIYGFLTHKTWIRQVWYVESVLLTMRNSSKVLCDFFFTSTILGMYKNRKHFYFCFHASETLKASPSMTSLYTVQCTVRIFFSRNTMYEYFNLPN